MDADDVVVHYLDLLDEHIWLSNGGLGWSIIQKTGETRSIEQLACETFGAFPEFRDVDFRESDLFPTVEVFITGGDGLFCVLERDGIHQRRSDWLRRLSRDARLWHVSWHPRGGEKLAYAVDGRVLVDYPHFCMEQAVYGDEPDALGDVLRVLTASPSNERRFKRAAAMAVVEIAGGLRLRGDLLQGRQRALLADRLTEDALSLRDVDPELHEALIATGAPHHRWICTLIADRMIQRYFTQWPEVAKATQAAADRDTATVITLMPGLIDQNIRLGKQWFDQPGGETREEDRGWMRWQAAIAARLAITALAREADDLLVRDGFELLVPAKNALGKGWPELRRQILKRITPT